MLMSTGLRNDHRMGMHSTLWILIRGQIRNMVKSDFFFKCAKSSYYQPDSSDNVNK